MKKTKQTIKVGDRVVDKFYGRGTVIKSGKHTHVVQFDSLPQNYVWEKRIDNPLPVIEERLIKA